MREPELRFDARGLRFTVEVFGTEDLPLDAKRLDVLLTVRSHADARTPPDRSPFAEVLVMDRSLSMASAGKMGEAKRAACAAVDALPDGSYLAVVAGNHEASVLFPLAGGLIRVDPATRRAAKERIRGLTPRGGTRIGRWLRRADELFAAVDAGIVRHAALYTDGRNEHETAQELDAALAACANHFVCDARGLGEDWNYAELLRITEALHGAAGAVIEVSDLAEDFAALMADVRRLVTPRVYLGLHLNERFELGFVRQSRPIEVDLTAQAQHEGQDVQVPLGSWAAETREYRLSLRVDPDRLEVGQQLRALRVTMLADAADGTREPRSETVSVRARRLATADAPGPQSAPLTREERMHDLGMAMRACAKAFVDKRFAVADRELREAIRLARALGATERLRLLESLALVGEDGALVVDPKKRALIQQLGIESTHTGPVPEDLLRDTDVPAAPLTLYARLISRVCPQCGETTTGLKVRICESCGHRFAAAADHDDDAGGPS
ncbi:vWA domain-containing protein [Actinospica robiniae]|uniref:vWA domain-containing protein n=1 Tax=Actinospica robiniae TaxID=304901 RepID=UPI00054F8B2E|nr:vWA domain-containing protein [Actinospica robiniae]